MFLKRLLTGLALVLCVAAVTPAAHADEQMTRPAVEAIVKDYLMKHPEVITDALNAMQARQEADAADRQKKSVADNQNAILNAPQNAVVGNPQGDVTVVEFFDYNCGYCKRGLADMVKLLQTDKKLKVVLRDYPILTPGSIEAADVALAVKNQLQGDKFFAFHQALLGSRGAVGKDRALEVAQSVGVDMKKLQADMQDPALRKDLAGNLQLGETLGINGTPSYVIGNEIVPGAIGYDALKDKIDAVRKCGQTVCG
ncbi:DsbA family protein [Labrys monachus]|uniref:Protein-disulfide isomerase n=1 Tax=Labrys monachus TaxID=217067 RepID=A0ABU0FF58_9HYPH|nr:DsbA family protein [Labrys monachus]MDQ0393248.1 protein-disulfide isomerase [Labrys monachus]